MRKETGKADGLLLLTVFVLAGFGLLVLYSMSAYNGQIRFNDAAYYLKKQLFAMLFGFCLMYGIARLDYHTLERFAVPAYLISLALSGAVLLFGDTYNGSRRWLSIGPLSFQPAEYAKPAVILLLASAVSRIQGKGGWWRSAAVFALVLPIVGLVGTNNLSTAVIILGIAGILLFISNPRYLPFLWMLLGGSGFLGIFLNPEQYEKGYQTMQGLYAIGSGGLFGRGIGKSIQKLGFVPEAQNDMIFSVICEELGFFGALFLMLLFAILIWRFMVVATHTADLFGALIVAGIMGHIALQVILNIAVVTNTIPNTGITLPFVSYGGTSMLFLLAEMGLALSVSRWRK